MEYLKLSDYVQSAPDTLSKGVAQQLRNESVLLDNLNFLTTGAAVKYLVRASVTVKADTVSRDEREKRTEKDTQLRTHDRSRDRKMQRF